MTPSQRALLQQRLASQENLLVDYLTRLEKHKVGREAVHVHLSNLMPQNRRDHHVRIAANSFENLVRMLQGQLFVLSNNDMFFVFKSGAADEVEAAVVKLRFLFSDDPLLVNGARPFVTNYNLAKQYEELLRLAQRLVHEQQAQRVAEEVKQAEAERPRMSRGEDLTPVLLGKVEDALARADLSNLLRRQAVCAMVGKAAPQPVFNELFISIADLRNTLLPNVNLASSPWLFQHLTETLDRRVLSILNRHDDRTLAGDISVNLNVGTLLSPEFLVFDDNVKAGMRGTIVIELQKVDIFGDPGAYMFARDFAHDRGYRICIDGLTYGTLPFIDRERLGADLVKVVWDPQIVDAKAHDGTPIAEVIKRCGVARVILCRCDDIEAIEFGHAIGLTLFQGRYVENLYAAEMRRREDGISRRRRR